MKSIVDIAKSLKLENLEVLPKEAQNDRISQKRFDWCFETFGDKTLISLLKIFKDFIESKQQSILTVSGPTEVGKTHLLKKSFEYLKSQDLSYIHKPFGYPCVILTSWEKIISECKTDKSYIDKIENCGALLMEDFLHEDDHDNKYTSFSTIEARELAYRLINRRVGKLTIIDTNKSENDIKLIDKRIHSRLQREGGRIVEIDSETKPYFERKRLCS